MSSSSNTWQQLSDHYQQLNKQTLGDLFETDANRFKKLSAGFDDLLIDFSKEKLTSETLGLLFQLARDSNLEEFRDRLFNGDEVNFTEHRSVLHMALRQGAGEQVLVDGADIMPEVLQVRQDFLDFAESVRSGSYHSVNGQAFTDVVNIGIGGSDLGPQMATIALRHWHDGPRVHFVSNVDGAHLEDTIEHLNPETTLVVISSKTFTTIETMTNAETARQWMSQGIGEDRAGQHFAAVSTNIPAAGEFGIDASRVFGFWDWVGGRYSVWSAIGLPLAIAIGAENLLNFHKGAAEIDRHFRETPLEENLPVMLALVGIWRRNIMQLPTVAIMPYDQRLSRLPAFIQQLDMESNGKRINRQGEEVSIATGPVIWGESGTNAQHSFFQLLHQGTDIIPIDFLLASLPSETQNNKNWKQQHHDLLLANGLAQANAFAFGRRQQEVEKEMRELGFTEDDIRHIAPHRSFPGDRPSTTICYRQLTPQTLGRLIALYEHKVFVQGVIWQINSYDQWGVELGKTLAKKIEPAVKGEPASPGLKGQNRRHRPHL